MPQSILNVFKPLEDMISLTSRPSPKLFFAFVFFFKKKRFYLFEREREREQEQGGGAEEEGEAGSSLNREPNVGLDSRILGS